MSTDQSKKNTPSDSGDPKEEPHSYRKLFPKKKNEGTSLLKPVGLDSFQETIDYNKLTGNLIRRSWIVLLCGLIAGIAGYFVLEPMLNMKKSYTASTKLLYKEQKRSVSEGSFNITTIKDMIVMKQNCQAAKTVISSPYTVEQIQAMSQVSVNKRSNFLTLHVTSPIQEDATKLANALAEMAVKNNLSFYRQKAEIQLKSLRDKAEKAKRDAFAAEQDLVNFQKENQIVEIESTKKLLVNSIAKSQSHIFEVENSLDSSKRELLALENELKNTPTEVKRGIVLQDFLRHRMQGAQTKLIELLAQYGEKNPKVKKMRDEIKMIQKAILNKSSDDDSEIVTEVNPRIKELESMINRLKINIEKSETLLQSLTKSLDEKLERLSQIPKLQLQLDQLESKKNEILQLMDLYEKKANEIDVHYRSPVADFEVYEPSTEAVQNRQIPQVVFLSGGVAAGLIISFLVILLLEIFDHRIFTKKELKAHYNTSCLGVIPKMHAAKLTMINSPLSSHVEDMAEKIAQLIQTKGPHVLAFCSTFRNEGKSTLANEMSKYYARLGLKTVFMDFNHHSNDYFDNTMDISNFLDPDRKIDNLFSTHDNLSKAKFDYSDSMNESLKSMTSNSMIEQLKKSHDVILIDTPGILEEKYAANAVALADEVVFVIKSGTNKKNDIDKAIQKLQDQEIYPIGIVLNAVDKRYIDH